MRNTMDSKSGTNQTFGPNWLRVAFLLIAILLGYAFGQDLDPSRASIPVWAVSLVKIIIVAAPALLLCWLLSVRLTVDPMGLRYRSLLGASEMRWDEVDQLYEGAVTTLLYGMVPLGTRYSFKLKSGVTNEQRVEKVRYVGKIKFTSSSVKDGTAAHELSFGSRFFAAERISALLNEFTFPVLWRKVSQRYKDGLDVSFGDFVVGRQGVKVDLLGLFPDLMKKPIPWVDVRSYGVEKGSFTLVYTASTSTAKTYNAKKDVAQIPNFRVMMALLQQIKLQQTTSSVSPNC